MRSGNIQTTTTLHMTHLILDQLFDSIDDGEVSILIYSGDIASLEPASVSDCLFSCLLVPVVSLPDAREYDQQYVQRCLV
jgi:hypothetical protein